MKFNKFLVIRKQNCENCNIIYQPISNNSKYCSASCKYKAFRKTDKYKLWTKNDVFKRNQKKYRNSSKGKKTKKKWLKDNREHILDWYKNWRKTEKGKRLKNYDCAIRYAKKKQRTPKWLSKEEKNKIKLFYLNRPNGYEVDHIIPLCGDIVSGLHVLNNLQYLSAEENRKKNKKFNEQY